MTYINYHPLPPLATPCKKIKMKDQSQYKLSFGVNSGSCPVLSGGEFSILVLRLVAVMVPEVFAQNLQPTVQVSATGPRNGINPKPEPDNTGKHTTSLVSLRK
jgi:hypothetical protein